MSQRTRLIIAIAVLAGGLLVLTRQYLKSRPPAMPSVEAQEVTETVKTALDTSQFDVSPTTDTMPDILAQIRSAIIVQSQKIPPVQSLGSAGLHDLADAFVERIELITLPDYERDFAAAAARGDPTSREVAKEQFELRMSHYNSDALPDMAPSKLEVSHIVLTADGEQEVSHQTRMARGFGVTTGHRTKNRLPVPEDPVREGMLAVEIIMPMMRKDAMTGELNPAIIGYQFAWNGRMKRWIPYQSVVFKDPNNVFSPPPI